LPTIYRDTLQFDTVVVLESLPKRERKTGASLHYNVLKPWMDSNPGCRVTYNEVETREQFLQGLKAVEEQLVRADHRPIVHIEAHGEREGIVLATRELVLWEDVREHLTRINASSQFNLLVVMAMCSGWWLTDILTPLSPAPAWGIIGPTDPVSVGDLRNATEAFYSELLSSYNAWAALDAMNRNLPSPDWRYLLQTSEVAFCQVFKHYVERYCTPAQLVDRENEMVAEIVKRKKYALEAAYEARPMARAALRDNASLFEHYRERFLMLDEIPANRERFKLTYQDCGGDGLAQEAFPAPSS